jgi:AcrR family transcriptional regulator
VAQNGGMSTPEPPAHSRSDARRNADRVQEVALQLLAAKGRDATVLEIAQEAGVGKATVYRNFPTKAALLAFAVEHHGLWLTQRLEETLAADEGAAGFSRLIEDTMQRIHEAPILLEALRPGAAPEHPVGLAVIELLHRLLARLRAQGAIRADAEVEDLGMLIIGTSEFLAEQGATPREASRAAELIVAALR